jgi:tetratricopeptide (TPR) repeat protein
MREGNAAALSILLGAAVLWTFLPALQNGFINYDDPSYVYANPHVRAGLTWENVRWAFTTCDLGFWHPLTWLSILFDWELSGSDAGGHHLTSVLLHAANAWLLFVAFRRMTGAPWRSFFVAALFALHPLHVESVAWACERKDVLSTFFLMLALWAYAGYGAKVSARSGGEGGGAREEPYAPRRSTFYALSIVFFVCGLMSKSMVVTLPILLLLLDYWPLRRLELHSQQPGTRNLLPSLWEKIPFFAVSLLFGLITIAAQRQSGAIKSLTRFPVSSRIANAMVSYGEYLWQTIWPARLAVFYPFPRTFSFWTVAGVALLGLAALAAGLWAGRKRPYLVVGLLWYLAALLPVIGVIQVGNQSHADRYTYVPLIGIFVAAAWGVADLAGGRRGRSVVLSAGAVLVLVACLLLTRRQIGYWRDSETVYRHALAVTANNALIHNNLGTTLKRPGQEEEAIGHLQEAVRLDPGYVLAQGNLGAALLARGRLDESIAHSEAALRLKPDFAGVHRNLGCALGAKGRVDEAITHLQEAIRLDPGDVQARYNLGYALLTKGRFDDAAVQFEETLRLKPGFAEAQRGLQAALEAKAGAARKP